MKIPSYSSKLSVLEIKLNFLKTTFLKNYPFLFVLLNSGFKILLTHRHFRRFSNEASTLQVGTPHLSIEEPIDNTVWRKKLYKCSSQDIKYDSLLETDKKEI